MTNEVFDLSASAIVNKGMSRAILKSVFKEMKEGKTPDQKTIIDFFSVDYIGGCLGKISSSMTIEQYQQKVLERCNSLHIKERAEAKIGVDRSQLYEINPICLSGFNYGKDILLKVSPDGYAVSSQYSVSWIFFSTLQIYIYTITFDMHSDNIWEETYDFFYQDITSFSTETKIVENIIKKGCLFFKKVTKKNYRVDALEIKVPNDNYSFSMRNSENVARSISAAKAMLRERKFMR